MDSSTAPSSSRSLGIDELLGKGHDSQQQNSQEQFDPHLPPAFRASFHNSSRRSIENSSPKSRSQASRVTNDKSASFELHLSPTTKPNLRDDRSSSTTAAMSDVVEKDVSAQPEKKSLFWTLSSPVSKPLTYGAATKSSPVQDTSKSTVVRKRWKPRKDPKNLPPAFQSTFTLSPSKPSTTRTPPSVDTKSKSMHAHSPQRPKSTTPVRDKAKSFIGTSKSTSSPFFNWYDDTPDLLSSSFHNTKKKKTKKRSVLKSSKSYDDVLSDDTGASQSAGKQVDKTQDKSHEEVGDKTADDKQQDADVPVASTNTTETDISDNNAVADEDIRQNGGAKSKTKQRRSRRNLLGDANTGTTVPATAKTDNNEVDVGTNVDGETPKELKVADKTTTKTAARRRRPVKSRSVLSVYETQLESKQQQQQQRGHKMHRSASVVIPKKLSHAEQQQQPSEEPNSSQRRRPTLHRQPQGSGKSLVSSARNLFRGTGSIPSMFQQHDDDDDDDGDVDKPFELRKKRSFRHGLSGCRTGNTSRRNINANTKEDDHDHKDRRHKNKNNNNGNNNGNNNNNNNNNNSEEHSDNDNSTNKDDHQHEHEIGEMPLKAPPPPPPPSHSTTTPTKSRAKTVTKSRKASKQAVPKTAEIKVKIHADGTTMALSKSPSNSSLRKRTRMPKRKVTKAPLLPDITKKKPPVPQSPKKPSSSIRIIKSIRERWPPVALGGGADNVFIKANRPKADHASGRNAGKLFQPRMRLMSGDRDGMGSPLNAKPRVAVKTPSQRKFGKRLSSRRIGHSPTRTLDSQHQTSFTQPLHDANEALPMENTMHSMLHDEFLSPTTRKHKPSRHSYKVRYVGPRDRATLLRQYEEAVANIHDAPVEKITSDKRFKMKPGALPGFLQTGNYEVSLTGSDDDDKGKTRRRRANGDAELADVQDKEEGKHSDDADASQTKQVRKSQNQHDPSAPQRLKIPSVWLTRSGASSSNNPEHRRWRVKRVWEEDDVVVDNSEPIYDVPERELKVTLCNLLCVPDDASVMQNLEVSITKQKEDLTSSFHDDDHEEKDAEVDDDKVPDAVGQLKIDTDDDKKEDPIKTDKHWKIQKVYDVDGEIEEMEEEMTMDGSNVMDIVEGDEYFPEFNDKGSEAGNRSLGIPMEIIPCFDQLTDDDSSLEAPGSDYVEDDALNSEGNDDSTRNSRRSTNYASADGTDTAVSDITGNSNSKRFMLGKESDDGAPHNKRAQPQPKTLPAHPSEVKLKPTGGVSKKPVSSTKGYALNLKRSKQPDREQASIRRSRLLLRKTRLARVSDAGEDDIDNSEHVASDPAFVMASPPGKSDVNKSSRGQHQRSRLGRGSDFGDDEIDDSTHMKASQRGLGRGGAGTPGVGSGGRSRSTLLRRGNSIGDHSVPEHQEINLRRTSKSNRSGATPSERGEDELEDSSHYFGDSPHPSSHGTNMDNDDKSSNRHRRAAQGTELARTRMEEEEDHRLHPYADNARDDDYGDEVMNESIRSTSGGAKKMNRRRSLDAIGTSNEIGMDGYPRLRHFKRDRSKSDPGELDASTSKSQSNNPDAGESLRSEEESRRQMRVGSLPKEPHAEGDMLVQLKPMRGKMSDRRTQKSDDRKKLRPFKRGGRGDIAETDRDGRGRTIGRRESMPQRELGSDENVKLRNVRRTAKNNGDDHGDSSGVTTGNGRKHINGGKKGVNDNNIINLKHVDRQRPNTPMERDAEQLDRTDADSGDDYMNDTLKSDQTDDFGLIDDSDRLPPDGRVVSDYSDDEAGPDDSNDKRVDAGKHKHGNKNKQGRNPNGGTPKAPTASANANADATGNHDDSDFDSYYGGSNADHDSGSEHDDQKDNQSDGGSISINDCESRGASAGDYSYTEYSHSSRRSDGSSVEVWRDELITSDNEGSTDDANRDGKKGGKATRSAAPKTSKAPSKPSTKQKTKPKPKARPSKAPADADGASKKTAHDNDHANAGAETESKLPSSKATKAARPRPGTKSASSNSAKLKQKPKSISMFTADVPVQPTSSRTLEPDSGSSNRPTPRKTAKPKKSKSMFSAKPPSVSNGASALAERAMKGRKKIQLNGVGTLPPSAYNDADVDVDDVNDPRLKRYLPFELGGPIDQDELHRKSVNYNKAGAWASPFEMGGGKTSKKGKKSGKDSSGKDKAGKKKAAPSSSKSKEADNEDDDRFIVHGFYGVYK